MRFAEFPVRSMGQKWIWGSDGPASSGEPGCNSEQKAGFLFPTAFNGTGDTTMDNVLPGERSPVCGLGGDHETELERACCICRSGHGNGWVHIVEPEGIVRLSRQMS